VRPGQGPAEVGPVLGPGLLIGVGLGGFVDGIVLHQLLRWHHMLSARPGADLTANLVADGLFHVAAWLAVVVGVLWLWRRSRLADRPWSWRSLIGPVVAGWGAFNLVEGVIDHHVLRLHHVRPGPDQAAYDIGFLIFGALLVAVGWALTRRPRRGSA